ncbi:MAG: DNA repair protein RadC [Kiritimatiellae bacterium]|nr:DNA repair protein RadC [Kiritimatiellia bacterium]
MLRDRRRKARGDRGCRMAIFEEDAAARPREKLKGASSIREMSDEELLGLIIRCGRNGLNAVETGRALRDSFGSVRNMVYADWRQIRAKRIPGVGETRSMELAAAFELARRGAKLPAEDYARPIDTEADKGESVFEVVRAMGVDDSQEHFSALYLDTKKRPLCPPKIVTVGLVNYSVIHPRELFRQAIQWGATSVIIAHNHPSGDATPSADDIELTRQLAKAAELIGIPLDDHVVVGAENTPGPSFVSIRAMRQELFAGKGS